MGSPLGCDAIAWHVIEQLKISDCVPGYEVNCCIEIRSCDRPGVKLLNEMKDDDFVILIDAMQANLQTGMIRKFSEQEFENSFHLCSSHGFGIESALTLGRSLNILPGRIIIYGIEIGDQLDANKLRQDSVNHKLELDWLIDDISNEINCFLSANNLLTTSH